MASRGEQGCFVGGAEVRSHRSSSEQAAASRSAGAAAPRRCPRAQDESGILAIRLTVARREAGCVLELLSREHARRAVLSTARSLPGEARHRAALWPSGDPTRAGAARRTQSLRRPAPRRSRACRALPQTSGQSSSRVGPPSDRDSGVSREFGRLIQSHGSPREQAAASRSAGAAALPPSSGEVRASGLSADRSAARGGLRAGAVALRPRPAGSPVDS